MDMEMQQPRPRLPLRRYRKTGLRNAHLKQPQMAPLPLNYAVLAEVRAVVSKLMAPKERPFKPTQNWFRPYVRNLYSVCWRWRKSINDPIRRDCMRRLSGLTVWSTTDWLEILINLSAPGKFRNGRKRTIMRAIRFGLYMITPPDQFLDFVKEQGGYDKCARTYRVLTGDFGRMKL